MSLNKTERLILANQYLILKKLYPEHEKGYSTEIKALEEGYEYHYNESIENFYDPFSVEESIFVINVLDMYGAIFYSYTNAENKEGLEPRAIKFPGFDGNNETTYLGFVRFYVKDLGRFSELLTNNEFGDFNSHRPMVSQYKDMLTAWDSTTDKYKLTIEEIKTILK